MLTCEGPNKVIAATVCNTIRQRTKHKLRKAEDEIMEAKQAKNVVKREVTFFELLLSLNNRSAGC